MSVYIISFTHVVLYTTHVDRVSDTLLVQKSVINSCHIAHDDQDQLILYISHTYHVVGDILSPLHIGVVN